MEALSLHHHRQPLCSSFHYYCSSLTPCSSSLFLSPSQSSPPSSSIMASSSDPPIQHPEPKSPQSPQSFYPFRKLPSFVTVTAASAFLFLGFCQNGFINRPITSSLTSVVSIQEALDEKSKLEDCEDQSILHLKLEEKVPIVHSFNKTKTIDEEAWQVLKEEVHSSNEGFEFVKIGFEKILEKERRGYHDCILEHLEMVDECKSLLKGIKVAMDRCERDNVSVKHSLRFFSKVVARIRVLEEDMLSALKYYKELDKD